MAKKVPELRIQRSVLRRVVQDKLQALSRGDFYVRNLGEENYDPIVAEVTSFDEDVLLALMQRDQEQGAGAGGGTSSSTTTQQPPPPQLQFSKELEAFIQILAASIMIDASMRGENAGESDTRFIKKKKKMLTRMLMGGKLHTLRREIVRFHLMQKRGVKEGSDELLQAIGVDPPETEVEEESSSDESEVVVEVRPKKRKYNYKVETNNVEDVKSVGTMDEDSSDEDDDDDDDDSLSDTATSDNTSLSKSGAEDGFSASATSSKKMKKAKKKARKEEKRRLKKERKRIKKEKKRKEKEEKKRKRRLEKELKKRKKAKHHHDKQRDNKEFMEEEIDNDMDYADEVEFDEAMDGQEEAEDMMEEEESAFEFKTREEFEAYRDEIISQIPKSVRKRFRQGGFSKWGKDWLPVIELGPFDVEPGPVRDMWMDMFHNTQKSGRDMTHLVFWYGVRFEDRGQGFSFVPDGKIVPYDEGERKGYNKVPKKIQTKIDKNQRLTKTEEQIKNGLRQIVSDMELDKEDRIQWMMNFKEDYELAAEAAEQAAKAAAEAAAKPKRKPGRPKKEETVDKPKRGPGRPKKVVTAEDQPPKRKPGRPKKSEQEKAASKAKKYLVVDEDQPESNVETDDDDDDENYGEDDSDSDDELKADTDSDTGGVKKGRKPAAPERKKPGRKPAKPNMTEEEKAQERREKAAAYREKKAREKAEALGLEYVPGRKGRKSKATIMEEEQMKFTKCEEVFCPLMDRLEKASLELDEEEATDCLNLLMKRVELVTPPFLRTYGLGLAVKQTRKAFESTHPSVKDHCKKLTNEMKRLYTERDKNIPDEFEPIKNLKDKPKVAKKEEEKEKKKKRKENDRVPSVIKSEQPVPVKTVVEATPKIKSEPQLQPEKATAAKLTSINSAGSLPDVVKTEPQKTEPQKKQLFSIKGMFEKPKPKPIPRPKNIATPNVVVSDPQMSPRAPKTLPSWVTGPAVKNDFHEQHVKERSFGLEFLIDAASKVSSDKFDPVSISQSFELAIFAETKLRGRDWKQYWEKVHDIVAMLSPGKGKPNAILQGIKSGNYQEPSELIKLSRREIETVNNLS